MASLRRALLALIPVLPAAHAVQTAAPSAPQVDEGAAWRGVLDAWAREFRDLRARLADPASHADAIPDYHATTERLATAARELALPLYHKAFELGTRADYTPELEARLEYLALAARAAELCGEAPAALRAEQARAEALKAAGRCVEARAELEAALARHAGGGAWRAYPEVALAELCRALGDPARALELVAETRPLVAAEASLAELAGPLDAIHDYACIDLGLPDLAWDGIVERHQRAEDAWSAGELDAGALREARLQLLHLLRAVGDDGASARADEFLADASLPPDPAADAQLLLFGGATELAAAGGAVPERAVERVRRALELGLDPPARAFARLELAEAALVREALDEAATELDGARAELRAGACPDAATQDGARLAALESRLALARGARPEELAGLRARLAEGLDELLLLWGNAPDRDAGVGYLLYGRRRDLAAEYTRVAIALDGPEYGAEDAFARVLALQAQGTLARRGASGTDLVAVRAELLGEDHGLLVYLPAGSSSHVFALDRRELVHAELPSGATLDRLRLEYLALLVSSRAHLSDPARRATLLARERELATALSDALLPVDVRRLLARWERVTISGLDALGVLPFEWFPLGDAPHLGTVLDVDYLASLPLGVAWARRPRRAFEHDYLLVGGAVQGERASEAGLEPVLMDGAVERALCAPFADAEVLSGTHATRSELLGRDLGATRVAQLLVHGVSAPGRERSLALLLSPADGDDGLLAQEDVANLRAPALVLLTGCRTGAGRVRKGDPLTADMGGALLAAGADAVVVAHADLMLSEVLDASVALASELVRGATPAAALRAARAAAVAEHGAEAPFRSGLLQLQGLGHRPLFPARNRSGTALAPWLGGAVVGAAAALVLARAARRRRTRGVARG